MLAQLTYPEWLKATGLEQEFVYCSACDGEGEGMCSCLLDTNCDEADPECPACAGEGYVACDECNGKGKIDGTRIEYNRIFAEEREKLRRLEQEKQV